MKYSFRLLCRQVSGRSADTTASEKNFYCFIDRNELQMVLGMTHEEAAAVQLVREYGQSYAKYRIHDLSDPDKIP